MMVACVESFFQSQSSQLRTVPPSSQPESLSGLIERVTFHNEENGRLMGNALFTFENLRRF